jgi:fumarate hydratase class II|uniref:Fumarate hydratase class II n=1 Tax=Desulfobacca acetoxidans TaxID=60893 RepID=A0A7V6DQC3_9BACT
MASGQSDTRKERDSLGEIDVPAHRYWGAGTQRSLLHFSIGDDAMPLEVIYALALIKKASALANRELGRLPENLTALIMQATDEILAGKLNDHFPLRVWMTGSGSQANMNVNEVIANRANELAGGVLGAKEPIHPNDHVNMSQSTNDAFPTAMHLAAVTMIQERLVPKVRKLREALDDKAKNWGHLVKIGRTHMMDAVPLTLGQEFSGYVGMLDDDLERIEASLPGLYRVPLGGTAVGTGLNAPRGFGELAVKYLASLTGLPFTPAPNKFAAMGAHDALAMTSATLKILAGSLYKIANDIRLLGSGPRTGIHELELPANEPGSTIMPGKINPTQCEALTMVAIQVMGYDAAVSLGSAGGYLELNVYAPLIIFNVIQSIKILADGCNNFTDFLVRGLKPDTEQLDLYLHRSLMLVTVLAPVIGYDRAADIAHLARDRGLTLKEAALKLGYLSEQDFDRLVDPYKMTQPEN